MWPSPLACLGLLAVAALAGCAAQHQVAVEPPPHVVHALLVEPWQNASSRHKRQQVPAERLVQQQALVAATLLNAAQERHQKVTAADVLRVLAEYQATPGQLDRQLNASLTALLERQRARDIQVEAMIIEQQANLVQVAESMTAMEELVDDHSAGLKQAETNTARVTGFVNSVTATVGRRVTAVEAAVTQLQATLSRLNVSIVDVQRRLDRRDGQLDQLGEDVADTNRQVQQLQTALQTAQSQTGAGTVAEPEELGALRRQVARLSEQVTDGRRRRQERCDHIEERLSKLEAAAAGGDERLQVQQLSDRLEEALSRLRDLEERETLLLPSAAPGAAAAGSARRDGEEPVAASGTPSPQVEPGLDLSTAGSQARGRLLELNSPDQTRPDVLTRDSLVTTGDGQVAVVLGRSIRVSDSVAPRTRARPPPHVPVTGISTLSSMLSGAARTGRGTPQQPERGGWRPVPDSMDRQPRLLPSAPHTADGAGQGEPAGESPAPRAPAPLPSQPAETVQAPENAATSAEVPPVTVPSQRDTVAAEDAPTVLFSSEPGPVEADVSPPPAQPLSNSDTTHKAATKPAIVPRKAAKKPAVAPRKAVKKPAIAPRIAAKNPSVSSRRPVESSPARTEGHESHPTHFHPHSHSSSPRVVDPKSRRAWVANAAGGVDRLLDCRPTERYGRLAGMLAWCRYNCPVNCPPTHCVCRWAGDHLELQRL